MFAVFELEANQTVNGSFYRFRIGWFVHPHLAAIVLTTSRWF